MNAYFANKLLTTVNCQRDTLPPREQIYCQKLKDNLDMFKECANEDPSCRLYAGVYYRMLQKYKT